jgi:hypothetical protein
MLKGDLTSTPLASLLLDLASDESTGCLQVTDAAGDEALVYLKSGLLYSISVPSSRPQLGAKFVSSGALAPEALAEALEAQRTELQGWRLGELLVHLGYVDEPVVEAFVREQVHESLWDLLRWHDGHWKFKKNAKTREDVCPPMPVVDLLESLRERGYEWESISAIVHGPNAVPMLSARSEAPSESTLDNDAWSMLCKIDGERTVSELARDCGYTLFEAGNVIVSLVQAGLVDIEEHVDPEGAELYGASALSSALSGELDEPDEPEEDDLDTDDPIAQLARLVTEAAGEQPGDGGGTAPVMPPIQRGGAPVDTSEQPWMIGMPRNSTESFAASIARVSTALSDVLGTPPPATDDIDSLVETRRHRPRVTTPGAGEQEWQRRRRLRSAAAAELANAQALAEALRPDHDSNAPEAPTDAPPRLVDQEAERNRVAAREAEEAERHAAERAAREAAAKFAQAAAEEAERHAAEQELARLAAEAEAERIAAEEAAAEEAARLAAEAERLAAEEAARLAAEEAARLAAEQAAAEEAERLAREAAEQAAAEEAQRLAEEAQRLVEEAEQLAAERAAAEVEAWDEYWHREEQARLAAEAEAARIAAEEAAEAERLAAEEAQRLAAEEAQRLAAEEEAQRLAAEEAARVAAEEEAARIAAEEAAQIAAELEAARLAAEQAAAEEAARKAEEEAARVAAEQAAAAKAEKAARRKAEKEAAEAAARQADEAAAATAMLIELNATSPAPAPGAEESVATEPEPEPEPEPLAPVAADPPDFTDTAALLRELSSLGTEEEERPLAAPVAPRAVNRPTNGNGNDKKAKKKIGLFGL